MKPERLSLFGLLVLLLVSCGEKDRQPETEPAVRAEVQEVTAFDITFQVQAVQCEKVLYGLQEPLSLSWETGSIGPVSGTLKVSSLSPLTDYTLLVQGIGPQGEEGNVVRLPFSTSKGPDDLYPWEQARNGIPSFADLTLVTLGWHNYNPPKWTRERFASHVSYDGHWLFDAFLCIDGWDPSRNLSFSLTDSRYSAVKDSWQDLLDAWLGTDGALIQLDAAVADAATRLGNPPAPRYVVMSLPDPIRYQYFHDKNSSTTYWGEVNGKQLDFSKTADQVTAYHWYMDQCRKLFRERRFRHLELAGFYILSEELPLDPAFFRAAGQSFSSADTWNWEHKNWEILVPQAVNYAHSCKEGMWWIPYHLAPGYKAWKSLGFDAIFMQPNYYWDHDSVSHPLSRTQTAIKQYRLGMELEFEYSLVASVMADGRSGPDGSGSPTFYAADVPLLRSRVREYMQMYRDSGMYGQQPLAVYSGTDAWHQLASSTDEGDRAMLRDLCNFILDSPLKK